MTKTELIAITAAILRYGTGPGKHFNHSAVQQAYEIFDIVDAIERDADRRRRVCFNCAGTGRVITGRNFESMPCPYCSTPAPAPAPEPTEQPPADTSSPAKLPLRPGHMPTCNAVLLADETKCNCPLSPPQLYGESSAGRFPGWVTRKAQRKDKE